MTNNKTEWYLDWFNSPFYHLLYKERDLSEATYFMNNLINKLQIDKNSSILDLACGRGRYSLYLSNIGHKVTGIDISKENISEAKKNESPLPITKIVDGYYEEIQKMGGNRWDTSSLIRRFRKK